MMKFILSIIISLLLFYNNCLSQDCNVKYEVNAGPDIDVCESGSVNLNGVIGGDATQSIWRGGKGKFVPDRNALNPEYYPDTSEIGSGVVLILVASNPKFNCPPNRSEIKITVNSQPKADAGTNRRVCMGKTLTMKGVITGKAKKTTWITNGTGKFDYPHKLEAVYTPSEKDIADGGCSIMLLAEPFGVCLPDSATMILMIEKGADFTTEKEINAESGSPVKLSVNAKESMGRVLWNTEGMGTFTDKNSVNTSYSPSLEDIQKGTINLGVMVTDKAGCTLKKDVVVHFKADHR